MRPESRGPSGLQVLRAGAGWLRTGSSVKAGCVALMLLGMVSSAVADGMLFDFGADGSPTGGEVTGPTLHWNNLPSGVGGSGAGSVSSLVDIEGNPTLVGWQMVSRFNGVNENGTTAGGPYPATATRDSLFGNTEAFSGLENITPIFKLTGLAPELQYSLTFYASRLGVSDNRETRYTVTGASEAFADLNVANNVTETARVENAIPDELGELAIALTPGPNNNNSTHFTYLGVLALEASDGMKLLVDLGGDGAQTLLEEPPKGIAWNNVTATVGAGAGNVLADLVTTNGTVTPAALTIVARFNGANENGSTEPTAFPASATRDSLFGNTAAFGGLANVQPVFKLSGLDPAFLYSFTFFASRTGVGDNRETRYTVTGATTAFTDLNAANNVANTATVQGLQPDSSGEITIAITAGPNNSNGTKFTYIGVMQMDITPVPTPRLLLDFGGTTRTTTLGVNDPDNAWNNVTSVGITDAGSLTGLVLRDGTVTDIGLQMLSRFNGVNENGAETSGIYPATATRDSLFGNTETFSGLENVTPVFQLTGLDPSVGYGLRFYASRMGVGDNRETLFTVTGASEAAVALNAANNASSVAILDAAVPAGDGTLTIALSPGENNNNGNHFVYLGVLQVDWKAPDMRPSLSSPAYASGSFRVTLTGVPGRTYQLQQTMDFAAWTDVLAVGLTAASETVSIPLTQAAAFFRAVAAAPAP